MRKLTITIGFLLAFVSAAYSQDTVTISRDAALKCLTDSDTVKAQATEITVLKQAISDHKDVQTNLKIELAKMSGEKTGAEQMNVRLTAIVDILLKSVRPKKIGLINVF